MSVPYYQSITEAYYRAPCPCGVGYSHVVLHPAYFKINRRVDVRAACKAFQ